MTTIDFSGVYQFVKTYLLSKRGIAISIAAVSVFFVYNMLTQRVLPMSYGENAVGANPMDLMATFGAGLTALISFIASSYLGVKPEVIQAVIAFEKDKTNADNQRRLGAAILGYIISFLGTDPAGANSFVMSLLNTLINKLEDSPTKDTLKIAASSMAVEQFKVIPATSVVHTTTVSK